MNHFTVALAGAVAWAFILRRHTLPKGSSNAKAVATTAAMGAGAAIAAATVEAPFAHLAMEGNKAAMYLAAAVEELAVMAAATAAGKAAPAARKTTTAAVAALGFTLTENLLYAGRHSLALMILRAMTIPHIAYALPWAQRQDDTEGNPAAIAAGVATGAALHAAVNITTWTNWQAGFGIMLALSLLIALMPSPGGKPTGKEG